MKRYYDTVTDLLGNAVTTGTVGVTAYPADTAVSIYSTDSTASPIPGSTVATDSSGFFSFYAPAGRYILKIYNNGILYRTINDVQIDGGPAGDATVVNTIAALKALSTALLTNNQSITALGYWSPADGGGGPFIYKSGAAPGTYVDNGGSIIVPTGGNGSAAFVWPDKSDVIHAVRFGATGAGGDETASWQSAINFAATSGILKITTPAGGSSIITTTLNCSNSRVNGTIIRDGLQISGPGIIGLTGNAGFTFKGQTGAGRAVFDTTGSQWLCFEYFNIIYGSSNPSTVGVYQGLATANQQTQNQRYHINVNMGDNAAANGGFGTIGIWNFGAEENTYDRVYLNANVPMVGTTSVNLPGTGYSYPAPYQPQAASHSCGLNTFTGETFLVSLNRRSAPIILFGSNAWEFENVYLANILTGGTNNDAMLLYGDNYNLKVHGHVEGVGTLHINGLLNGANIDTSFGGTDGTNVPMLVLDRGAYGIIKNSEINFWDETASDSATPSTRPLMVAAPTNASEAISCSMYNTRIRSNQNQANLLLPAGLQNILWNAKTQNVLIQGLTMSYEIGSHRHKISFQEFPIPNATVVELCKIIMPAPVVNVSAGGIGCNLAGMVGTTAAADNSRSTVFVQSQFCISTEPSAGNITVNAPATTTSAASNVNAGGNAITATPITLTINGVNASVSVKMGVTQTGANNSAATFTGVIEMYWSGWASVAPQISNSASGL